MLDSPYHGAPAMMTTQKPATLVNGSHSYNELVTLMKYQTPTTLTGLDGDPYMEGVLTAVEHHGAYAHVTIRTEHGMYNSISLALSYSTADERPIRIRPERPIRNPWDVKCPMPPKPTRPKLTERYMEPTPMRFDTPRGYVPLRRKLLSANA